MMRRVVQAAILGCLVATIPAGVLAATPASMSHVVLNVVKPYKASAAWKHVMASATLAYSKGDVTIKLTADNLPMASALGKHVYVLFAVDGKMWDHVGKLKISGHMASVKGMVMMTKVTDLYVYAQAADGMHHSGVEVLAAMVG
jgi:hypothetical protein